MKSPLRDAVAFVTRGSRGISASVALRLARAGVDATLSYRRTGDQPSRSPPASSDWAAGL